MPETAATARETAQEVVVIKETPTKEPKKDKEQLPANYDGPRTSFIDGSPSESKTLAR